MICLGVYLFALIHSQAYRMSKGLPANAVLPVIRSFDKISCLEEDRRLPLFGYSVEDLTMLIVPMIINR
jgi:hypothetical protein